MKEDYLWNKTGSDPEIERLENALKAFRYQQIAPPVLPAKVVPFERKSPRGVLRLSLAFASFAALLIVWLGVWLNFSGMQNEKASNSPNIIAPPTVENSATEIPFQNLINPNIEKEKITQQSVKPKVFKVENFVSPNVRGKNLSARNIEIRRFKIPNSKNIKVQQTTVKLTEEEIRL